MERRRRKTTGWQASLPFSKKGGARPGAGRPKSDDSGVPHTKRARLASRFPVHVTVRLVRGLPSLRVKAVYELLRKVFIAAEKQGFRIVHYSIQGNHVHLIVEAKDRENLARGMQGLLIRFARSVNRLWGRKGTVFNDRYHDHILRTPREVRNALLYVLRNAWRHRIRLQQAIDMFSSGPWFSGWRERFQVKGLERIACPVSKARTWLLDVGWLKHGSISLAELPGG